MSGVSLTRSGLGCGLMLTGCVAYGSKVQKSLVDVNRKAVEEGSSGGS